MKFAKVMFLQVSVILSTGGVCMVAPRGGMCGCSGGAYMVAWGHVWLLGGACVVALGGHAWFLGGMCGCSGGMCGCSGGVHGCSGGACMVALGGVVARGVCVVFSMRYGQ